MSQKMEHPEAKNIFFKAIDGRTWIHGVIFFAEWTDKYSVKEKDFGNSSATKAQRHKEGMWIIKLPAWHPAGKYQKEKNQ